MTRDIIVSRRCMVGPGGYFMPGIGPAEIDGAVTVSVDFFSPYPDPEMGLHELHGFPPYRCDYEIRYGGEVIHVYYGCGMDNVASLLSAMQDAANRFDLPYFNKIDADTKYRDAIPYIDAIPREWWHDMRIAGTEPMWIAEEQVIFQRADGQRIEGIIAIGCPSAGAMPEYPPSCRGWIKHLDGSDDYHWAEYKSGSAFQALQLAITSMAGRLRAFLASGGRVLTPAGDADVDLAAMFGPLIADQAPPAK